MTHTRKNQGVCSRATEVDIRADGMIQSVRVEGGCDGNLSGICALLAGFPAQEGIARLSGITCDGSPHSCPRQIALCLQEALALLPTEKDG